MKVFVTLVRHHDGENIYVSNSHAGAMKRVVEYVEEWWTTDGPSGPKPDDDDAAISEYFHETKGRESFEVQEVEVHDD